MKIGREKYQAAIWGALQDLFDEKPAPGVTPDATPCESQLNLFDAVLIKGA